MWVVPVPGGTGTPRPVSHAAISAISRCCSTMTRLGELPGPGILRVVEGDLRHPDRALVVGDHLEPEIDVRVARIGHRHGAHHRPVRGLEALDRRRVAAGPRTGPGHVVRRGRVRRTSVGRSPGPPSERARGTEPARDAAYVHPSVRISIRARYGLPRWEGQRAARRRRRRPGLTDSGVLEKRHGD